MKIAQAMIIVFGVFGYFQIMSRGVQGELAEAGIIDKLRKGVLEKMQDDGRASEPADPTASGQAPQAKGKKDIPKECQDNPDSEDCKEAVRKLKDHFNDLHHDVRVKQKEYDKKMAEIKQKQREFKRCGTEECREKVSGEISKLTGEASQILSDLAKLKKQKETALRSIKDIHGATLHGKDSGEVIAYPDGAEVTTTVLTNGIVKRGKDGVTTTIYDDGTVKTEHPNGETVTRHPDGTEVTKNFLAGITKTKKTDGTVVTEYEDQGLVVTKNPDGTEVTKNALGKMTTDFPSGKRVVRDTDGRIKTIRPDGTISIEMPGQEASTGTIAETSLKNYIGDMTEKRTYPEKTVVREMPDRSIVSTRPDGTKVTDYPNGSRVTEDPDGRLKVTLNPDRTMTVEHAETGYTTRVDPHVTKGPDGVVTRNYPDGTVMIEDTVADEIEFRYADGSSFKMRAAVTKYEDGTRHVSYPDGSGITELPDGKSLFGYGDGTMITGHPDGTTTQVKPGEGLVITKPDGTVSTRRSDGTVATKHPDGSMSESKVEREPPIVYPGDSQQWLMWPDGGKEVTFDDGTTTEVSLEGVAVTTYPDGTKVTDKNDGTISTTDPYGYVSEIYHKTKPKPVYRE